VDGLTIAEEQAVAASLELDEEIFHFWTIAPEIVAVGGSARLLLCWLIVHQVETTAFSVCTFRVDRFA
jgi:hypothetical protein